MPAGGRTYTPCMKVFTELSTGIPRARQSVVSVREEVETQCNGGAEVEEISGSFGGR